MSSSRLTMLPKIALAGYLLPCVLAITLSDPTSVLHCKPITFNWQGGTEPFTINIYSGSRTLDTYKNLVGDTCTYTLEADVGTNVVFGVRDSTGASANSSAVTVGGDPSLQCGNDEPSSSSASSTWHSTSAYWTPSPSSTYASATAAANNVATSHSSNTGAIAGGVVGGVATLGLVGLALFFCLRRRRRQHVDLDAAMEKTPLPRNESGLTRVATGLDYDPYHSSSANAGLNAGAAIATEARDSSPTPTPSSPGWSSNRDTMFTQTSMDGSQLIVLSPPSTSDGTSYNRRYSALDVKVRQREQEFADLQHQADMVAASSSPAPSSPGPTAYDHYAMQQQLEEMKKEIEALRNGQPSTEKRSPVRAQEAQAHDEEASPPAYGA